MKVNDVYKVRYKEEYKKTQSPHTNYSHCFEGFGVVTQHKDNYLILSDTYWGIGRTDGKSFSLEDIGNKVEIEYYCNLDQIEDIYERDLLYYEDEDVYRITDQHGCFPRCVHYFKLKTASKSVKKIKHSIERKISDLEYTIKSSKSEIERHRASIEKMENGDIENIWI